MRRYHRLIITGIIFGLLVFIFITLISDVNQITRYAEAFPWWLMLPILGLRMVNWMLRFFKWHFYLNLVGVKGVSYRDSAAIFVTGFPLSASPGKAAEVLKSFILENLYGAPVAATLPVVAAERLSDGVAVLVLTAWAILNLSDVGQYWPAVLISGGLIAALILLLQFRRLCITLLDWLSRLPVIGKFAHHIEVFYESSYKMVLLPNMLLAAGLGLLANVLDGVGVYLILIGLGQPPGNELFFKALLAISLSVIAGSVSGSPGGIGASDLTIGGVLISVVGLDRGQAGFATLLARFVQLWWGVLVGSVVAFLYRKRLFPPSLEHVIDLETQAGHTASEDAQLA
ncbi:MAG: flippase-like domain-containing protein [Anaerolineae bacterium]|nr:flippase-like domain-containing protein [Anaerolineae bacterium]